MRKLYLVLVTAAGLLLAVGASAEAGGGRAVTGGPSGPAFTPPGWSNSHWSTANSGTNNTLPTQPPGWSHNSTGQTNAGTISGSGGIPHGLNTH
jgi:hypothetical protein